jgi:hypothetical protein
MGLGKKNITSAIDHIYYMNMSIQQFVPRHLSVEIDFKKVFDLIREYNRDKDAAQKIKFSAILMKATALAYAYKAPDGTQPYRRLSGYPPMFAWQKSFESKTIDISLMLVRAFSGVSEQTMNYRFKAVDKKNVLDLSQQVIAIQNLPEDKIEQFRFLKKIAKIPRFVLYCLLHLNKIPWIQSKVVAPTSISILSTLDGQVQGEHISMLALGKINKETHKAPLSWCIDHRLGFGMHFSGFINQLKTLIESPDFLIKDITQYSYE